MPPPLPLPLPPPLPPRPCADGGVGASVADPAAMPAACD
eukprot:CAMPEP_0174736424 /NCGR_PEP_ID=MMETSP1094-20130205/66646_1 /TAXON_ID=156173 /ORGANISM="Chrysochromulina brevifilum, Strain UTEX LB 985" /LENGTH=38 /DNA_ID= /DNA_START= /DNA_END= /DNA_ORIENTATION=